MAGSRDGRESSPNTLTTDPNKPLQPSDGNITNSSNRKRSCCTLFSQSLSTVFLIATSHMSSSDESDAHKKRGTIPSFLKRSGIKLKEGLIDKPTEIITKQWHTQSDDSSGTSSAKHPSPSATHPTTPAPQPRKKVEFQRRSFLSNEIVIPTQLRDEMKTVESEGEVEKKGKGNGEMTPNLSALVPEGHTTHDKLSTNREVANEGPHAALMDDEDQRSHPNDGKEGTQKSNTASENSSLSYHTAPSSLLHEGDVATNSRNLSPAAMAAYEVAREYVYTARRETEDVGCTDLRRRYQRRVDRGEEKAPTDQDRANYANWKRNYLAFQAKKQREEEDKKQRQEQKQREEEQDAKR